MKSMCLSMSLFLLLIMLQLMRREHKHRTGILIGGLLKLDPWMDFWNVSVKLIVTQFSFPGLVRSQAGGRLDCRTETLNTCIKLADPLLEDPRYVFPAANEDVDHVCKWVRGQKEWKWVDFYKNFFSVLFPKTWSEFVTCIKKYTSDCLTADQVSRSHFDDEEFW